MASSAVVGADSAAESAAIDSAKPTARGSRPSESVETVFFVFGGMVPAIPPEKPRQASTEHEPDRITEFAEGRGRSHDILDILWFIHAIHVIPGKSYETTQPRTFGAIDTGQTGK